MVGEHQSDRACSTKISVKGKRTTINWNWDRNELNSNLSNAALALSLDEDFEEETIHWGNSHSSLSLVSLVICLMQQITRSLALSSFNCIYKHLFSKGCCSENKWVQFSLAVTKTIDADVHEQQSKKMKNFLQLAETHLAAVCKILDDFDWFGFDINPCSITCILPDGELNRELYPRTLSALKEKNSTREPNQSETIFLWYDPAQATYNGIVERRYLYATREAYKAAVTFDLAPVAKEWFRQQLDACSDDDVFANKAMGFAHDLAQVGGEMGGFEKLLDSTWVNIGLTLRTLCFEILINPEDYEGECNGSNRRAAESDLAMVKRELFQALVCAAGECKTRRVIQYEENRVKAIDDRLNSQERHFAEVRKIKSEMNRLTNSLNENVGLEAIEALTQASVSEDPTSSFADTERTLEIEIKKGNNGKLAMQQKLKQTQADIKDELRKQQELLAWAKFKETLGEFVPPFELLSRKDKHPLFNLGDAEKLIQEALKMLDNGAFLSKQEKTTPFSVEDRKLVKSYAQRAASFETGVVLVEELQEIFRDMIKKPEWLTSDSSVFKVNGRALILSEIILTFKLLCNKPSGRSCNELLISAEDVIYIDEDWQSPGVSLSLHSAFSIKTWGYGAKTINTSGLDAVSTLPRKAEDAKSNGMDGNHGLPGNAGESAGHVNISCKQFFGELVIEANGGRGTDGQDGGDGAKGNDGEDGVDGKLPESMQSYSYYSTNLANWVPVTNVFDTIVGTTNAIFYGSLRGTVLYYMDNGQEGKRGQNGGAGGNGGKGGQGGQMGTVMIDCPNIHGCIDSSTSVRDGEDGSNGKPGTGGEGGKGGRNGYAIARAFEPNDMNPWLWVTGKWKEKKGLKLTLEEVKRRSDGWVMGYKIVEKNGTQRQSNGENGKDGLAAQTTASQEISKSRQKSVMHSAVSSRSIGKSASSLAGSHARFQAEQIAQHVALQQEALEKQEQAMVINEEKTNALRMVQQKASELKASSLRNQREVEEADREIKNAEELAAGLKNASHRIKQAFEKAESTIMSNRNERTSQRVYRMVDQQQTDIKDNVDENDENSVRHSRQTMLNAWFEDEFDDGSDGVAIRQETGKNYTILEILDDLLRRFIAAEVSEDVTQKLSMLIQSLVFQINRDEESDKNEGATIIGKRRTAIWSSVEKIILFYLPQPLDLENSAVDSEALAETMVQCILEINRDVELVRALQRIEPVNEKVMKVLAGFVQKKIHGDKQKNKSALNVSTVGQTDLTGLLFCVRTFSRTFGEMEKIFNKLIIHIDQTTDVNLRNLLENTFTDYLFVSAREMIEQRLSRIKKGNLKSEHSENPAAFDASNNIGMILKELWQHCSKRQNKKTTTAQLFLREYLMAIKKLDSFKEYDDKVHYLMNVTHDFSRKQLQFHPKGLESLEKWLFSNEIDSIGALHFMLKYGQVDLEDLDNINSVLRDSQKTSENEIITEKIFTMIHKAFEEHLWEPAVSEVMNAFDSASVNTPISQEISKAQKSFCESIKYLAWKHSRLGFTERLKFCAHLIKELANIESLSSDLNELNNQKMIEIFQNICTFIKDTEEKICGMPKPAGDVTKASKQSLREILDLVKKPSLHSCKQTSGILIKKLRRVLYDFDELSFNKVEELQIFNEALNTMQREHFGDKEARMDYDDLKNKFTSCWPSLYLSKWSKPLDEVEECRKHLRSQWEDQYINRMAHSIADRTKALRRMDILLAKYAVQTSWFLSPGESLDKWRSLATVVEHDWSNLEELLIQRILGDFAMMKMLFGHVGVQAKKFQSMVMKSAIAAGLDIKDNMVSTDVVTALRRAKAREDLIARQDAWFITVMDVLLFALRSAPKLDDSISHRLAALAENVEIIVECGLVGWIGGLYAVGETPSKPIVLDGEKLSAYKSKISECTILAASFGMVRDRLLSALSAVDGMLNSSIVLVGRLDARIRQSNAVFKYEIESLGTFVTSLSNTLAIVEKANNVRLGDVVNATIKVLDNQHTINALGIYRDKHWSVLQRIEIWTSTFGSKFNCRPTKPKDVQSWLLQLLEICVIGENIPVQDEALLALRLSVSANLLNEWFDMRQLVSRDGVDELIGFFNTCSQLLDNIMPKKLDIMSETIKESLSQVQNALFRQLLNAMGRRIDQLTGAYQTDADINKEVVNPGILKFLFQEKTEQAATVSSFLARTLNEANQFVLDALSLMCKDPPDRNESMESFIKRFVSHLYATRTHFKYVMKKKKVLACLYPIDSQAEQLASLLSSKEKSLIGRWISMKELSTCNQKLARLFDWIKSIEKSRKNQPAPTNDNEMWATFGFELLNEEERLYTNLLGRTLADDILSATVPSMYLHSLKSAAGGAVCRKFVSIFFPDFDARALDEALQSKKNDKSEDAACITPLQRFKRAYDRAHFFAKRDQREFEWLVWLDCTVLPSIKTGDARIALDIVTALLLASVECEPSILFQLTLYSRPQQWIHDLIINSMTATFTARYSVGRKRNGKVLLLKMAADMRALLLAKHRKGKAILKMLAAKLDDEAQLVTAFAQPIDCTAISIWLDGLRRIQRVTESELERFADSPVRAWYKIIRHIHLTERCESASLANQLANVLDRRFGPDVTDRFLEVFARKHPANENSKADITTSLSLILRNVSRHPWTAQMAVDLANGQESDEYWCILKEESRIKEHANALSKEVLSAEQLITNMKDDLQCQALVGSSAFREKLATTIEQVKRVRDEITSKHSKSFSVKDWSKGFKRKEKWARDGIVSKHLESFLVKYRTERFKGSEFENSECAEHAPYDVTGFLAVASVAVYLEKGYFPRDAQLLAVLLFTSDLKNGKNLKRMGQISTGEGKTLITALLAAYHALTHWYGKRQVNVITSSSVLAEANVIEIKWFFEAFDISVSNNCDNACVENESERTRRYNSDVVYGDLSNFQRDELLSEFFGKNVTMGRKAGALIVDEVDSMLLDKGENLLYLSHSIPEMDDLMSIFVDIWSAVQDKRIPSESESAIHQIQLYVKERIKRGETTVPVCLQPFVDRQLLSWIKSAFRAKNKLKAKDVYKVDDVGSGRGMQVVVMDKETGVEQVNMQWTHGLHQFLQLKHGLRLSPVSLKAVFMSNIGFFKNRHDGALYGLTGTLGSDAECELLRATFDVEFFRMPRFKRRLCWEEVPLVSNDRNQWLDNMTSAVNAQATKRRAVLVICESIVAAEAIFRKLEADAKTLECNNDDANSVRVKVALYISSFDQDFQDRQHETELQAGDVIVATNLAGRGTDFKVGADVASNGGLHVIISYVPSNARVEDQAQGRTGRAGQLGSFQFVVNRRSARSIDDSSEELDRLKSARDAAENRRLENIRTKGLQRIYKEEELFNRFRQEIYEPVKRYLAQLESVIQQLQLDFLTNQWAVWLDENAELIHKARIEDASVVDSSFEQFKARCLKITEVKRDQTGKDDVVRFAKMPSELLKLGRAYEEAAKPDAAVVCYETVLDEEPIHEAALIHAAKSRLQKADFEVKQKVKPLLVRARQALNRRIDIYIAASQIASGTTNSQLSTSAQGTVNEQVSNLSSLLQIQASAIEQIIGRPLSRSIAQQFNAQTGEASDLTNAIHNQLEACSLLKPFRVSKKVSFSEDGRYVRLPNVQEHNAAGGKANDRHLDWHSCLEHCKSSIIKILKKKLESTRVINKHDFMNVADDCQTAWQKLVCEGYIGQVQMMEGWYLSSPNANGNETPLFDDLTGISAAGVLKDWLDRHIDEEFYHAVGALSLDTDKREELKKALESKGILVRVDRRTGRLLKKIPAMNENEDGSEAHVLPSSLQPLAPVLSAWVHNSPPESMVSSDTIPLAANQEQAMNMLWDFLVMNHVIKEPAVLFSKKHYATKESTEGRLAELTKAIKTSAEIRQIFERYIPLQEPINEISFSDFIDYNKSNKIEIFKSVAIGMSSLINSVLDHKADNYEHLKRERESEIKDWLNKKRRDGEWDAYATRVTQALKSSLGELKTFPFVSATFKPLSGHLTSDQEWGKWEEELQSFKAKAVDIVLTVECVTDPNQSTVDWRALVVVTFGVAQLVTGIALTAFTFGGAAFISAGLIKEGISDMSFGLRASTSGSFSWGEYGTNKLWSVGLSVLTIGVGAYLTSAASAGQAGVAAFQGLAGRSLAWAIAKEALIRSAKVLQTVIVSSALERSLAWAKDFVLNKLLCYIQRAVRYCLSSSFEQLAKWLERLKQLFLKQGNTLSEAMKRIENLLGQAKKTPLHIAWLDQLSTQASSVAEAFGSTFSQAGRIFEAQEKHQLNVADQQYYQDHDPRGTTAIYGGFSSNNTAAKYLDWMSKAYKIVKVLKNAAPVVAIASHAPVYVTNVNESLGRETKKASLELEKQTLISEGKRQNTSPNSRPATPYLSYQHQHSKDDGEESLFCYEDDESTSVTQSANYISAVSSKSNDSEAQASNESAEWAGFQEKALSNMEAEILRFMVDRITSAWVQPWLQCKLESLIQSLSEKAVKGVSSYFKGEMTTTTEQLAADTGEGQENNKEISQEGLNDVLSASKEDQLKRQLGEDCTEQQTDGKGKPILRPKNYEEFVESMGSGRTAGILEMQTVADCIGQPIVIIDDTDSFGRRGKEPFTLQPSGDANNKETPIKLRYTKNQDGTGHVELIGDDEKVVTVNVSSGDTPNRCLYLAVSQAKGCSADHLLKDVKQHAANNKLAQYMYKNGVDQVLPELRCGRQADVYYAMRDGYTTMVTKLTSNNVGGTTNVDDEQRENIERFRNELIEKINNDNKLKPKEKWDRVRRLKNSHLGHVLMEHLGGSGRVEANNIYLLLDKINVGVYKRMENQLRSYFKSNPNSTVHLNIEINRNVPNASFFCPVEIRFIWGDIENEYYFVGPTIRNSYSFLNENPRTSAYERYNAEKSKILVYTSAYNFTDYQDKGKNITKMEFREQSRDRRNIRALRNTRLIVVGTAANNDTINLNQESQNNQMTCVSASQTELVINTNRNVVDLAKKTEAQEDPIRFVQVNILPNQYTMQDVKKETKVGYMKKVQNN